MAGRDPRVSTLAAPGVLLERPRLTDADRFLRLVDRSRPYHEGLVDPPASEESFAAYVRRAHGPSHEGFLVRASSDRGLVGVVNINNIVHGGLDAASLGYYRLAGGGGRRVMVDAIAAVVDHGLVELGLHRLEANVQPHNERSIAILSSLGFRLEGFSPAYLRIGGHWRDHERWALTADEWVSPL
jgi:[ribosomal protein S5]-alanine N-acetyltransferase